MSVSWTSYLTSLPDNFLPVPWHPHILDSWEKIHLDSIWLYSSCSYAWPALQGKILPFFQYEIQRLARYEALLGAYPSFNAVEGRASYSLDCSPQQLVHSRSQHKGTVAYLSHRLSSQLYCGCCIAEALTQSPFDTFAPVHSLPYR